MIIKSFVNHKGGVGKTTLSYNYAHHLGKKGKKVLFLDLDPQMAASFLFESWDDKAFVGRIFKGEPVEPAKVADNISLLNAGTKLRLLEVKDRFFSRPVMYGDRLRQYLVSVAGKFDVCVIDTPPIIDGMMETIISISNYCVIPLQSEILPIVGLESINTIIDSVKSSKYFIVINMFAAQTKLQNQILDELRENYADIVLPTPIRRSIKVVDAQHRKIPITSIKCAVADDFTKVFRELDERLVK